MTDVSDGSLLFFLKYFKIFFSEKEFFAAVKKSLRVVALFYRPNVKVCDVMSQHIQRLAEHHHETCFLKVRQKCFSIFRCHKKVSFLKHVGRLMPRKVHF